MNEIEPEFVEKRTLVKPYWKITKRHNPTRKLITFSSTNRTRNKILDLKKHTGVNMSQLVRIFINFFDENRVMLAQIIIDDENKQNELDEHDENNTNNK